MKLLVYTQRVEIIESYNERRDCADQRIPEFISACGYIPIPLPNNKRIAEEILNTIKPSGIVLTGGNSMVKYGGNAKERDMLDSYLIEKAEKEHIPLYGFCRGMQSILDYYGNEMEEVSGHVAVRHTVEGLEKGIEVNSYHNQACLCMNSECLEILMKSKDGVIEKIKHKSLPIIGTMWHPEREKPFRDIDIETMKKLFGEE